MLEKKETVQKTFRLDSKINDNLERLSEVLERTQNDLVNVAIQNLLEENDIWLGHNIFVDYAFEYWANGEDVSFNIEDVYVELKNIEETDKIKLKVTVKNGNEILESYETIYDSLDVNTDTKIKNELRYLYHHINPNGEDVKSYIKSINNYK